MPCPPLPPQTTMNRRTSLVVAGLQFILTQEGTRFLALRLMPEPQPIRKNAKVPVAKGFPWNRRLKKSAG
jgi:hypothetical protein